MFFVLNFPIAFNDFTFMDLSNYFGDFTFVLYYAYYSLGFYIQLLVNSDFRNEFLRMVNLKVNAVSTTEIGRTTNNNLEFSTVNNRI